MQKVSEIYKQSINNPLRERGYIRLFFGLINQNAQINAIIDENEYTDYSKPKEIFYLKDKMNYATLEKGFTTLDGSMVFIPRVKERYYDKCSEIASKKLISESQFTLTIDLNTNPINLSGITIDFGKSCPSDFDILNGDSQIIYVRNNKISNFVVEEILYNTKTIKIIFYKMLYGESRLHINHIIFGYGLFFSNDNVINSSLESYFSPITENITQIDFTVTLDNHNKYFDIDNPTSIINFFDTGQIVNIEYGYQLPNSDKIEWIQGNSLLCSEWEADDYTATIRCYDVFRNMNQEYYFGKCEQKSYFELAKDILNFSNTKNYNIYENLKELTTNNPIPIIECKQALQLIASACCCILSQSRNGKLQIENNFDEQNQPVTDENFYIRKDDMMSSPKLIKKEEIKEIQVFYYIYKENYKAIDNKDDDREILIEQTIQGYKNKKLKFNFDNAFHDFKIELGDKKLTNDSERIIHGVYSVTVIIPDDKEYKLKISAYRYTILEQYETVNVKEHGKIIKYRNPLISDDKTAKKVANWLKNYYSNIIEYEYNTRGNPELDINDIIYQWNDFYKDKKMKVKVCKETLNFDKSFSGKITTRRV